MNAKALLVKAIEANLEGNKDRVDILIRQASEALDRCPPHKFMAAWEDDARGVLFCQWCGDIRELQPPTHRRSC